MHSVPRLNSRMVKLLVAVMAAIIVVFVLFEQQSSQWITSVAQQLTATDQAWLLAVFLIAILAFDIILPIPSSVVAVFAATSLGFWAGAGVIWLGLMLSCCCGYAIGMGSGQLLGHKFADKAEMQKAHAFANKVGPGALVTMRGVPVLAETSVIAAGLVAYPLLSFLFICALANAGLALAYAYVGAKASAEDSFLLVIAGSILVPGCAWLLKSLVQRYFKRVKAGQLTDNSIDIIHADFQISHHYPVLFENRVFDCDNPVLKDILVKSCRQTSVLVYIDEGLAQANPLLVKQIQEYFSHYHKQLHLIACPQIIPGSEAAKQAAQIEKIYHTLLTHKVDRHNCVLAIGGGAVLDAVGFACATFHRGVKLLRMPSTVLAQNDAGVGVKNGINFSQTKNLLGSFMPPMAVLNDAALLQTLTARDRRAGLAEAVKVAAIRDQAFFTWMEKNVNALTRFEHQASQYAIARCAQLHLAQITTGGDPFESGNGRPLDYGHWSAHKLEAIADYNIRHGEAVAIGMVLDARYAVNIGLLAESEAERLTHLLEKLGFTLWHSALDKLDGQGTPLVLAGIDEFRQHLGGELCITLLRRIGISQEVNILQQQVLFDALTWMRARALGKKSQTNEATGELSASR